MEKSREQFEELAVKEGLSLEVFNGDYNWLNTRLAWEFWQASRESLEVELPKSLNDNCDYSRGFDHGLYIFRDALISSGVKVK